MALGKGVAIAVDDLAAAELALESQRQLAAGRDLEVIFERDLEAGAQDENAPVLDRHVGGREGVARTFLERAGDLESAQHLIARKAADAVLDRCEAAGAGETDQSCGQRQQGPPGRPLSDWVDSSHRLHLLLAKSLPYPVGLGEFLAEGRLRPNTRSLTRCTESCNLRRGGAAGCRGGTAGPCGPGSRAAPGRCFRGSGARRRAAGSGGWRC